MRSLRRSAAVSTSCSVRSKSDPLPGEVRQRVCQRMLGGPAHRGEWTRRPARRQRHQPVAAVRRRTERRLRAAQCTECRPRIVRPGVGDVAADDRHAAARKSPERAIHPHAEIAAALRYPRHPDRQPKPCMVRRDRQHRPVPPVGDQCAQQAGSASRHGTAAPRGHRSRAPAAASPRPVAARARTRPPCPSSVEPRDQPRRHAGEIQRQASRLRSERRYQPWRCHFSAEVIAATSSATSRRRPRRRTRSTSSISGSGRMPPTCAQQVAMDQQPLVAIRQRQHPAAPRHQPLQPPRARIVAVEAEAEVAGLSGEAAMWAPIPAASPAASAYRRAAAAAIRRAPLPPLPPSCAAAAARRRHHACAQRARKFRWSRRCCRHPPPRPRRRPAPRPACRRKRMPPHSAPGSRPTACSHYCS